MPERGDPEIGEPAPADALEALQARLGVRFRVPSHLRQALIHESYAHEAQGERSNERLEFLGDAILGLVVSEVLYRGYPDREEGELTRMKALLVSRVALADLGRELGLGDALLLGRGGEVSGGRQRASLLANAFEAIVGALYLDGGFEVARSFIERCIGQRLERLPERTCDFKSTLQQETQRHFKALPTYRVVSEAGPPHARLFEVEVLFGSQVLGRGRGPSKKEAQQQAASQALDRFPGLLGPEAPGMSPLAPSGTASADGMDRVREGCPPPLAPGEGLP